MDHHPTRTHTTATAPTIGLADFSVDGNTVKTWYKYYGNLKSDRVPLVVLHGGPGLSHEYMMPHQVLFNDYGQVPGLHCRYISPSYLGPRIPVVFYDQLGSARSTHLPDAPTSFWSMDLYMDELDNLLRHLAITEYDLLGHSWGGMLAANFSAARQPRGLRRLVIMNCPASMELASAGIHKHLQESFPPEFYEMLKRHDADGTVDAEEYKAGELAYAKKHISTLDPWPAELVASLGEGEKDNTVNMAMMGKYFLRIAGNMKDWSVIPVLHKITVPTLLLHSPTDQVHEVAIKPFFEEIPKIKWVEFYHSSHLAVFEEPERYFKVVTDFLRNVE